VDSRESKEEEERVNVSEIEEVLSMLYEEKAAGRFAASRRERWTGQS